MNSRNLVFTVALALTIPSTAVFSQTKSTKATTPATQTKIVLATVDGTTITTDDLNERIAAIPKEFAGSFETQEGKIQLLEQIVNEKTLLAAAKKDGIEKTDEFKDQLLAARNQIVAGLYIQKKIPQTVEVSEEEAFQFFVNNPARFKTPERRNIQQILVATEADANTIANQIRTGAPMDVIAKAKSLDPGSAPNGGLLGWIVNGQTVPEFNISAFSAATNEITVAKTQFGYHIIKVLEIQPSASVDFPQVKTAIQNAIANQKRQQLLNDNIAEARKTLKVTVDASKL